MDFQLGQGIQKQYNGKFGVKLVLGIIPLLSIVIFIAAMLADMINDPVSYGTNIYATKKEPALTADKMSGLNGPPLAKDASGNGADEGSLGRKIEYAIFRNLGMITTQGNIFASAFFLDSAVHNKKEGMGKKYNGGALDTYRCGIAVVNVLTFIVIGYNAGLVTGQAMANMKGYNTMVGLCEHLVVQVLMIIYFYMFYPKYEDSTKHYDNKTRNGFSYMGTSVCFVGIYQVVFTALGYILKAANAFPIFGDMSSNGYFPYLYMDFTSSNTKPTVFGLNHVEEFIGIMLLIVVAEIATFEVFYASAKHEIKTNFGTFGGRRNHQL